MGILEQALENKRTAVILGHVNPDGDCIGSCLGLYNYLTENFEGLSVTVYLESMGKKFSASITTLRIRGWPGRM